MVHGSPQDGAWHSEGAWGGLPASCPHVATASVPAALLTRMALGFSRAQPRGSSSGEVGAVGGLGEGRGGGFRPRGQRGQGSISNV